VYSYTDMIAELQAIARGAEHVHLDEDRLDQVTAVVRTRLGINDFGTRRDYPDLPPAEMLQFLLVGGAHNFLFWQRDPDGAIVPWHVTVNGEARTGFPAYLACQTRALRQGQNFLDPDVLLSMTLTDIEEMYRDEQIGEVTLQFLPERLARFHEVGRVLKARYAGSFLNLLEQAGGHLFRDDGNGIIQQLITEFPLTYGDWPFCKKAMVTIGNLYQDRDRLIPRSSPYRNLVELHDPEKIEIGADYYRPYFLYRVGVLRIDEEFRIRLINRELIERESPVEREYRAWTILAGHELAKRLGVTPHDVAVETWGMGYVRCRACFIGVSDAEVPCHYRAFCYAYNEEPALMQTLWPLVMTTAY